VRVSAEQKAIREHKVITFAAEDAPALMEARLRQAAERYKAVMGDQ
jgi:hypothetical protein